MLALSLRPLPTPLKMSLDEFKRQVQNQFTVVLSWDEVRALQKLYGEPGSPMYPAPNDFFWLTCSMVRTNSTQAR